jgi:integrase
VEKIHTAWSRETFRKYRRSLTHFYDWLLRTHTEERTLTEPGRMEMATANFIVQAAKSHQPTVVKAMLGHLKRVTQLLTPDGEQGILSTLSRAIGRSLPTPSRRYDAIWDIDKLFTWVRREWGESDSLPLNDLQTKTMLLIMIFQACRLAELGRIKRPPTQRETPTTITLTTTLKQANTMTQELVIRRISCPELCPLTTLLSFLRRTPAAEDGVLFHALQHPGEDPSSDPPTPTKPLTTPDICPLFLKVMKAAGIPPHYTAYSVKHAVVTKLYKMGATDEQVVEYGHWAKGSPTPRRWYNITTLEEEWLGAKLMGDSLGLDTDETLEKFATSYMPPTRTPEQAAERALMAEALVRPTEELVKSCEA